MRDRVKALCLIVGLTLLVFPAEVRADAAVVQVYCEEVAPGDPPVYHVDFGVANDKLPRPICDLHVFVEPGALPPCEILEVSSPRGWEGVLDASGASWFAVTPADCIPAGECREGFDIVLARGDCCCFVVEFTGPAGEILLAQEECFMLRRCKPLRPPLCGNGVINWKAGETCDPPGSICGSGGNPAWICSDECKCEYRGGQPQ